ncbi:hypothetical protein HDU93_005305 [Gonapodya sp. JEL0774]|nr:hypothetical protein HDU93_005305 [Gonapodya sp. JEL0774]
MDLVRAHSPSRKRRASNELEREDDGGMRGFSHKQYKNKNPPEPASAGVLLTRSTRTPPLSSGVSPVVTASVVAESSDMTNRAMDQNANGNSLRIRPYAELVASTTTNRELSSRTRDGKRLQWAEPLSRYQYILGDHDGTYNLLRKIAPQLIPFGFSIIQFVPSTIHWHGQAGSAPPIVPPVLEMPARVTNSDSTSLGSTASAQIELANQLNELINAPMDDKAVLRLVPHPASSIETAERGSIEELGSPATDDAMPRVTQDDQSPSSSALGVPPFPERPRAGESFSLGPSNAPPAPVQSPAPICTSPPPYQSPFPHRALPSVPGLFPSNASGLAIAASTLSTLEDEIDDIIVGPTPDPTPSPTFTPVPNTPSPLLYDASPRPAIASLLFGGPKEAEPPIETEQAEIKRKVSWNLDLQEDMRQIQVRLEAHAQKLQIQQEQGDVDCCAASTEYIEVLMQLLTREEFAKDPDVIKYYKSAARGLSLRESALTEREKKLDEREMRLNSEEEAVRLRQQQLEDRDVGETAMSGGPT